MTQFERRVMNRREFVISAVVAAAGPVAALAQSKAIPIVGYLGASSRDSTIANVAAMREGLRETGHVEGRNIAIEYRWAEGDYSRLTTYAAEFAARKVDVIVTSGSSGIAAARAATSTIPIVFFGGGDLVADGTVASLARPGGNITGISIFGRELNPKRFELLAELVPQAGVIALLINPTQPVTMDVVRDVQEAAAANRRPLAVLRATSESEINAALATLIPLHAVALVVEADPFFGGRREQIVALAARHAVPAIYEWREFADAGGLMSYGPSLTGIWRQVGVYAGRIVAGADPANLPIQQPTTLELIINLKTANLLGLNIPPSILARADEVIE